MFRLSRDGTRRRAIGNGAEAIGDSPIEALRSLKRRKGGDMGRLRRWVVYAASEDNSIDGFANAVACAGSQWKPLAVHPLRLDEVIKAVQPEAVIVATRQPRDEALLRRTFALHGRRRLVVDDRQLPVLTRLLSSACPRIT